MKRRSALFALTATFAAGLLLFSSAQGQGGGEPPSEDPGRLEGTNDCMERTNRIDCVDSALEVIARDSTNCLAEVGSRIEFDFKVVGYDVSEIEHTFIGSCLNKTNYTERVTNAFDVVWTITGGQGGVVASGSKLPVELSYTNLWPGVYTAKLIASVCDKEVTKTASVYLVKTFMAGGPYIGINATDTPMGKDGLGRTNLTGFAAFTLPSIPNAPNQIFTFTLASPAGCVFTNGASVIAVPAVDGMVSTSVYEKDKESAAVTNEVITVADSYGGCLASNRFTVVRVDVSMDGLPAAEEESTGAFIPWNIDRDWAAGSSGTNAFANILDYQTNRFANADVDLRQVKISVLPNDLPPTEEVELTGYEYLWEDQTKTRPATNVYTLSTLSNTTFWVEGRAISGTLTNMSITATHKPSGATDRVNYTVVGLAVEHPKYLGIDATGETGPPGKTNTIEILGKLMPPGVPQGSGDIEYEIIQSNAGCTFNPAVGAVALLHEADKPSNTGEWETFKISCPTGTALPIISSVRVVRVEVELRELAEDKEEKPGAFIGYNGDDDNFSNAEDRGETNVTGEDDLVECKISILPDDLPDDEMIDLTGDIQNIWQTNEKIAPIPPEMFISDLDYLQFWIEGHDVSGGPADKNLHAQHRLSHARDKVKYTILKVDLKSVEFSQDNEVKRDSGAAYNGDDWLDNDLDGDVISDVADKRQPVSYKRGEQISVAAKWEVNPAVMDISQWRVRGSGPDGIRIGFAGGGKTVALAGAALLMADTACDAGTQLPNTVKYYSSFDISWELSFDGGATWSCSAEKSDNLLYVTHGEPQGTMYHTALHVGCFNANTETDEATIVSKIWAEFSDRSVKKVDPKTGASVGNAMDYWGPSASGNISTGDLLQNGDGQCGAWSDFFEDVNALQNITVERKQILPDPTEGVMGFHVKNVTLGPVRLPSPPAGHPDCKYLAIEVDTSPVGLPGQGGKTPTTKGFLDHSVNMYGGVLYDPSYGLTYGGADPLKAWEEASVDAFGCMLVVVIPPFLPSILEEPNDPITQKSKWAP